MSLFRFYTRINHLNVGRPAETIILNHRTATTTKHGVVLPQPHTTSFGLIKVVVTVTAGLLIGAGISKNIANFLEENDLFVPEDDDDDD